jgi:MarR family transcriptional regulator, transcriptional regulator for hemolysin
MLSSFVCTAAANDSRDQTQFDLASALVMASHRFKTRFAERFKDQGQTLSRRNILSTLAATPEGMIQSELADRLGVQAPTMVKLLDGLERQGLISRQPVPGDRRAKLVVIEKAGLAVLSDIDGEASNMRNEMFQGVSDADLATVQSVLDIIVRRLDNAPSSSPEMLRLVG